jgi:carboxyl-terminal processing protease
MKTPKKIEVWLPLLFGLVMAAGMYIGFGLAASSGKKGMAASFANRQTLQEIMDLVAFKYVDSAQMDSLELAGIEALLGKLDPHSTYLDPMELADANAELEGGFSGIGIEYLVLNDTPTVAYAVPDGPGARAGMEAGDKMLEVNGQAIAGRNLTAKELRKMLRGSPKSSLALSLLRGNQRIQKTLERSFVALPSVDAAFMIRDSVGYISLTRFSETSYREFMEALDKLKKEGMQRLILDLRNNPGGILTQATNIADELLRDGLTLVSTRGLHTKSRQISSTKPGEFEKNEVYVLMNELSASASEVLAGALQDNDRGTIVGRRSFGKGLVQEQFALSNGGALRLTVARYYTPLGRSIQKPFSGDRAEYHHEAYNRMGQKDSAHATSPADTSYGFTTKKGKRLSGGGGIWPDVEVPADTTNDPMPAWAYQTRMEEFSLRLFMRLSAQIKAYPSARQFHEGFQLPANTLEQFLAYARADGEFPNPSPKNQQAILHRIKAHLARFVWRQEGFKTVWLHQDATLQKTLQIISL